MPHVRECLLWLFLCVAHQSSLVTVSGLFSLFDLFHRRAVDGCTFRAKSSGELCWCWDHHEQSDRQIERCKPSTTSANSFRCRRSRTVISVSIVARHSRLQSNCIAWSCGYWRGLLRCCHPSQSVLVDSWQLCNTNNAPLSRRRCSSPERYSVPDFCFNRTGLLGVEKLHGCDLFNVTEITHCFEVMSKGAYWNWVLAITDLVFHVLCKRIRHLVWLVCKVIVVPRKIFDRSIDAVICHIGKEIIHWSDNGWTRSVRRLIDRSVVVCLDCFVLEFALICRWRVSGAVTVTAAGRWWYTTCPWVLFMSS